MRIGDIYSGRPGSGMLRAVRPSVAKEFYDLALKLVRASVGAAGVRVEVLRAGPLPPRSNQFARVRCALSRLCAVSGLAARGGLTCICMLV